MTSTQTLTTERTDLLESLGKHRFFLRLTAQDLTEEQARLTPTASALSVGGLIKHVAACETMWAGFAEHGAEDYPSTDFAAPGVAQAWAAEHRLGQEETLAGVLDHYAAVAAHTDELVRTLSLDTAYPLPEAPWFEPGASWTVRRVLLHVIAETAQHAGHADIIRETIDGRKSMG